MILNSFALIWRSSEIYRSISESSCPCFKDLATGGRLRFFNGAALGIRSFASLVETCTCFGLIRTGRGGDFYVVMNPLLLSKAGSRKKVWLKVELA